MSKMVLYCTAIAISYSTLGCGLIKRKGKVALAVKGITAQSGSALSAVTLPTAPLFLYEDTNGADRNMVSFTPISMLVPITDISMDSASVYSCKGTEAECYIDLSSQTDLDKLSANTKVLEGKYKEFRISTCNDYATYHEKIKGSVKVGNTTYYTTDDGSVLTTDASKLDYVTVTNTGSGGCSSGVSIPGGATVKANETIKISMFMSTKNIAFAGPVTAASGSGGCVNSTNNTKSACFTGVSLAPYVGETAPVFESYKITHEKSGPGQLQLLFDASGSFIGGFAKKYYDGAAAGSNGYVTPIQTFTANADGTYYIQTFGGGSNKGPIDHLTTFANFKRATHQGTVNTWAQDLYAFGVEQSYVATRE